MYASLIHVISLSAKDKGKQAGQQGYDKKRCSATLQFTSGTFTWEHLHVVEKLLLTGVLGKSISLITHCEGCINSDIVA